MSDRLDYSGSGCYRFPAENSGSGIGPDFWRIRAAHGWNRPETRKPERDITLDSLLPVVNLKRIAGRVEYPMTCTVCGDVFLSPATNALRCQSCRAEHVRIRERDRKRKCAANKIAKTGPLTLVCCDCPAVVERTSNTQVRCPACAQKHDRLRENAQHRQRRADTGAIPRRHKERHASQVV